MAIDWTPIVNKYKGLWVGLKDDEQTVVGSGKTVQEVLEKSKRSGFPKPILLRVPTKVLPYVGSI
ncbi:MAG: hypothetical protein HYZ09_00210 [Candidatus Kerfeldbacteria bacterium]|nr:hypothetical protein [Candidatus Kerfeldbacteria bacterium]